MKKIVFLTSTRADFGKLKALIKQCESSAALEPFIFATGMHLHKAYGYTLREIEKSNFKNIHPFINQSSEEHMDITLAKTIQGLSDYVKERRPDLIVVHGDRVETLAGAIVGALNNIRTAHIEGGEVSGTVDELIRHSVSKLSHIHFVANQLARKRLLQMGEDSKRIFVIGSPDIDIMTSGNLPDIHTVKKHYNITFQKYALLIFHPVTTEISKTQENAESLTAALLKSHKNYIIIHSNNDMGHSIIGKVFEKLNTEKRFKKFPSIRFEYFLTLLKHAQFIIGNSSCGIREAPVYGIPSINIGSRQQGRASLPSILHVEYNLTDILKAINKTEKSKHAPSSFFGKGNSSKLFLDTVSDASFWKLAVQKIFIDSSQD